MGHVDPAQAAPPSPAQRAPSTIDVNERVRVESSSTGDTHVYYNARYRYTASPYCFLALQSRASGHSYHRVRMHIDITHLLIMTCYLSHHLTSSLSYVAKQST